MLTQLQHYYLNQMGIRPWIKKDKVSSSIKLLVVIESQSSAKENNLLRQIMCLVNLQEDQIQYIDYSFNFEKNECLTLVFSNNAPPQIRNSQHLIIMPSLKELLDKPRLKKNVLKQLYLVHERLVLHD